MGTGFGFGFDIDGAGPDLFGPGHGLVDGGGALHTRRLGGIGIELISGNDAHTFAAPIVFSLFVQTNFP